MVVCDKCREDNPEDLKNCQKCGKSLEKEKFELWKKDFGKEKTKSPILAAALNIIIAGLGFIYIKEYLNAVVSFVIVVTADFLVYYILNIPHYLVIFALIFVMVWNYYETKKYNMNLQ